jgi:hypothetical protein
MAEMGREPPPYQAFGSVVITYSECSTCKEIKHHEHTKCKWFANQHEPAFCRRHSPLDRRRLRSGFLLVVFVDQFDGLEPAVVGTRGGVVGAWDWQHVVDHGYVGYVEHDGVFELLQRRSVFHLLHERLVVNQFGFRSAAGLSRGAVSGTRVASATGQ